MLKLINTSLYIVFITLLYYLAAYRIYFFLGLMGYGYFIMVGEARPFIPIESNEISKYLSTAVCGVGMVLMVLLHIKLDKLKTAYEERAERNKKIYEGYESKEEFIDAKNTQNWAARKTFNALKKITGRKK